MGLLYVYYKNCNLGLFLMCSIIIGSSIASFVISSRDGYVADYFTLTNPPTFYNDFFIKPWVRISTYVLGVCAGVFYTNFKKGNSTIVKLAENVLNKAVYRWTLYVIGGGLISSTVWCIIPV